MDIIKLKKDAIEWFNNNKIRNEIFKLSREYITRKYKEFYPKIRFNTTTCAINSAKTILTKMHRDIMNNNDFATTVKSNKHLFYIFTKKKPNDTVRMRCTNTTPDIYKRFLFHFDLNGVNNKYRKLYNRHRDKKYLVILHCGNISAIMYNKTPYYITAYDNTRKI